MRIGTNAEGGFASATMAFIAVTVCLMAFIGIAVNTTFTDPGEQHGFGDVAPDGFSVSGGKIVGDADDAIASHMEFHGYGAISIEINVLGNVSQDKYKKTHGCLDDVGGVCYSESGSMVLKDEHGRKLPAKYVVVAWR